MTNLAANDALDFDIGQAVAEAHAFCRQFRQDYAVTAHGVICTTAPVWAKQLLRKRSVVAAVMEKAGSSTFVKQRPRDTSDYQTYVQKQFDAQKPLQFRIPVGPVKNMNLCGDQQFPDMAEYLMFMQLARFAASVAALYPYGVKMQIVPDDVRAQTANLCPDSYVQSYISGLRQMVDSMGFSEWLQVESGQMRLCDLYRVQNFKPLAEQKLLDWKKNEPETFAEKWQSALENAQKNFVVRNDADAESEIAASAWRYLVAHQSEILSGMWSPVDAFPMIFANHPNNYQLRSMASKKTRLPWQVKMPISLLDVPIKAELHLARAA